MKAITTVCGVRERVLINLGGSLRQLAAFLLACAALPLLSPAISRATDLPAAGLALARDGFYQSAGDRRFVLRRPNASFIVDSAGIEIFPAPPVAPEGDGHAAAIRSARPLRLRFGNTNPVWPRGCQQEPGVTNVYGGPGRDPRNEGIVQFRDLSYPDLFPGVDATILPRPEGLRYDFRIRPGGRPGEIGGRGEPAQPPDPALQRQVGSRRC